MTAPVSRTGSTDREVEAVTEFGPGSRVQMTDKGRSYVEWRQSAGGDYGDPLDAFSAGWDAARAAAAPDEDPRIAAVLALHAAHHCSCGGRRWVEDQNWAPPSYNRGQQRCEGAGLMPCGFCNHGGWNTEQWDPDGAVSCDECDQAHPCPTVRALHPAALLAEQPGGGR